MNRMIVLARAVEGRREELGRWYDERHIPDLLAVPGFMAAERHEAMTIKAPDGLPTWDFMLVYDIEGDPMACLGAMGGLMGSERMPRSDALDSTSTLSIVGIGKGRIAASI